MEIQTNPGKWSGIFSVLLSFALSCDEVNAMVGRQSSGQCFDSGDHVVHSRTFNIFRERIVYIKRHSSCVCILRPDKIKMAKVGPPRKNIEPVIPGRC